MKFRKLLILFILLVFIFPTLCQADDLLDDEEASGILEVSAEPQTDAAPPSTNSKNIVAMDRKSLSIVYEKNAYETVPMASTTKIMTCILVLENCDLNEMVTISKDAANIRGSTLGITSGAQISMNDLLLRPHASLRQ